MRFGFGFGVWTALLAALVFWLESMGRDVNRMALHTKLEAIVRVGGEHMVSCSEIAAQRPLIVLALGQSNAANHGTRTADAGEQVLLIADGKCIMAVDPLPGSTGAGGSIWLRMARRLARPESQRLFVLSVMGVDATSILDWTDDGSALKNRLVQHLSSMRALGLSPHLVLWQQGEADARLGTTGKAYGDGLDKLAAILDHAGSTAPIVMARSTVCRSAPDAAIRSALEAKARSNARFQLGPDTDTLIDAHLRSDGCHFSAEGLDRAAQLWVVAIGHHVP